MDKKDKVAIGEIDELILELMYLGYLVNKETDYCVFIHFCGHVDSLQIEIAESKKEYSKKIASTQFYTDDLQNKKWGWLKAKKTHLLFILKNHEIETGDMEEEIVEVIKRYTF